MKLRLLSTLLFAATLSLAGCNQRTDGTAGDAVTDMDKAASEGGVQADATVIDNDAGATVTANPDSLATDSTTAP